MDMIRVTVPRDVYREIAEAYSRDVRLSCNLDRILHCLDQLKDPPDIEMVRGWLRVIAADVDVVREPSLDAQFR